MRALFVILQALLGLVVIALAWMIAAAIVQDPNKLPSLGATLSRAHQFATSDDYRQHLDASTSVLLKGMLPAIIGGIVLGILAGATTILRWLLAPLFITLAAVPLIALMPPLLLWLGLGPTLTVVAVAVITVFPVANAVMMSLSTRQGDLALAIVRGLRWGTVFGAAALVICEMLTSRVGVATSIMNAGTKFDITGAAAGIVFLFVPLIVFVALLQGVEEELAA